MALKMQKKTFADKINELIASSKPTHFDSDEEPEDTKAKVVEYYDENDDSNEVQESKIRAQNIDTLDKIDKR